MKGTPHVARLKAVFEQAMLVALASAPPALTTACSSGSGESAPDAGATSDASVRDDGQSRIDANADGGQDAWWAPGCQPGPTEYFDGGDGGPASCEYGVPLPCGLPAWVTHVAPPQCFLDPSDCRTICKDTSGCNIANGFGCDDDAGAFVAPDGAPILVLCDLCPCGTGRRPAGLVVPPPPASVDPIRRFLARCAFLEAASVGAFRTLARDLRRFGAPTTLVEAARRSARDEVRHARVMARLARVRRCEPPAPRRARAPLPSLLDAALDNERQGCVRETYGALVAKWQAAHARDGRLATAMARIAADETRHAALAWRISAWMAPRLGRGERRRLDDARREEAETLERELGHPPGAALVGEVGLPDRAVALKLHERLQAALWA